MFRWAKGYAYTGKRLFEKTVTIQYPEQKPKIPEGWRGRHYFYPDRCTACDACARVCPTEVITVVSHRDPETKKKILDDYTIDFERCILCGYCEESCPVDAIKMGDVYELASYAREQEFMTQEEMLPPGYPTDVIVHGQGEAYRGGDYRTKPEKKVNR